MTLGSLQYKLNMTRIEAAKVTDQYWAQFPRIKPWMNEIVETCMTNGYLRYWSGRIWREEDRLDMYKGCNALIQGGCADLLSVAAIRVDDWCEQQPSHHIVNLVHDEIITEVPLDDILRSSRIIGTMMQVPDIFDIPFATDVKVGYNYGDMEKIEKSTLADESINTITIEEVFELAIKKKHEINAAEEAKKHPIQIDESHFDDEEEDLAEEIEESKE
jgi:DNA polymerase-1